MSTHSGNSGWVLGLYGELLLDDPDEYRVFIADMSEAIAEKGGRTAGIAHHSRGLAYWKLGEWDAALVDFDAAARLLPKENMPNHVKARLLEKLGRLDDAISSAEQAVRLAPKAPDSRHLLGKLLVAKGRLQDALPHYEAALRLEPTFWSVKAELDELKARLPQSAPGKPWWKPW